MDNNKKYILYGTGWYAEKFLYEFKEKEQIAYCIDGYRTETFHGYRVYTLEHAPDIKNYTIIVTAIWENYKQIRKGLTDTGLREFQDFIWAEAFGKKIAVINANCHGMVYKDYLCQSKSFTSEYVIWNVPQIHLNKKRRISRDLLNNCDLYIHQDIRWENPYGFELSDEYILPQLKNTCKTITVPNLVGIGRFMFPTSKGIVVNKYGDKELFVRDLVLDQAYEHQKNTNSIESIKEYALNYQPISKEEVKRLFSECLSKLKEREKNWDIIISDYILKNYKTEKIFYNQSHPAKGVMKEIVKRLSEKLGINDIDDVETDETLGVYEEFVPLCVKDALGLQYDEKYVRGGIKTSLLKKKWMQMNILENTSGGFMGII